ncbi:MAG: Tsac [Peptococcaceae bacterium]|nr:Tsac [Peptococcaceae bacterium]
MGFEELVQNLSLANVCRGELEADFQRHYPEVIAALKSGQTGSITIKLDFQRKDEGQMIWINYSISKSLPKVKKVHYAQMTSDFQLKTEAPPKKKESNLSLFPGKQPVNE